MQVIIAFSIITRNIYRPNGSIPNVALENINQKAERSLRTNMRIVGRKIIKSQRLSIFIVEEIINRLYQKPFFVGGIRLELTPSFA